MTSAASAAGPSAGSFSTGATAHRVTTETKASFKTTEFFAYLIAAAAIVITALVVDSDGTTPDPFNAEQALRYLTFLTIGYMISRGLAKAGSREPYTKEH